MTKKDIHPLDKTVSNTYFRGKELKGDVGIEIELEGRHLNTESNYSKNWIVKNDGSLRNGYEYVTDIPLPIDTVEERLTYLFKEHLKRSVLIDSIRTSIHMHVNVLDFTIEEVYKAIGLYWIFEKYLIMLHGANRKGNLFCLSLEDADGVYQTLMNGLKYRDFFNNLMNMDIKYGALNLQAVRRFGSLEFRFLRGNDNPVEIAMWAKVLHNLVQTAKKLSITEILELMSFNPGGLYRTSLPKFIREEIEAVHPDIEQLLRDNYIYTLNMFNNIREIRDASSQYRPIGSIWRVGLKKEDEIDYNIVLETEEIYSGGKKKPKIMTAFDIQLEDWAARVNEFDFDDRPRAMHVLDEADDLDDNF